MTRKLPENEFGPNIQFREKSFPGNKKAMRAMADKVDVIICEVRGQSAPLNKDLVAS